MARPIEPTPVLYGEDAERVWADLERVCSVPESAARIAYAKAERKKMMSRILANIITEDAELLRMLAATE